LAITSQKIALACEAINRVPRLTARNPAKCYLPAENDIFLAMKALLLVPGLSNAARQVAGTLIDHFNRDGGRCDPSVERLAKMIGINRITVLRATKELCKKDVGLFTKISHGGYHNTASYQPQWERFREIVSERKLRMQGVEQIENVAEMQPLTSQECDLGGNRNETQTYLNTISKNRSNIITAENPELKKPQKIVQEAKACEQSPIPEQGESPEKGFLKEPRREVSKLSLKLLNGGRPPSRAKVAKNKASERIDKAMMKLDRYAEISELISPEKYDQAALAETRKRGAGIEYILASVERCA
jgi:DNA-binding transcriptional regulator YhcF (GntR family)